MNIETAKISLFPCCALPSRNTGRREMGSIVFLGNDIIDRETAKPQTHKLRQRSLEKLFNPKEVQFIQNHQDAILAFWQLWSVKESAYKAWQRINQAHPVFNPKRFVCSDFQKDSVNVNYENFQSKVKTMYTKNYIYSQCDSEQMSYHIFNSKASYHNWLIDLSNQDWILKKSDYNIPNLFNIKTKNTVPVSISKDANFVAIAW